MLHECWEEEVGQMKRKEEKKQQQVKWSRKNPHIATVTFCKNILSKSDEEDEEAEEEEEEEEENAHNKRINTKRNIKKKQW